MTEREYLDDEIEEGFIEQVKLMMKANRESNWDEQKRVIKYLRHLISELEESSNKLEQFGIKNVRLKYTGEKIGGFRLFKEEK